MTTVEREEPTTASRETERCATQLSFSEPESGLLQPEVSASRLGLGHHFCLMLIVRLGPSAVVRNEGLGLFSHRHRRQDQ